MNRSTYLAPLMALALALPALAGAQPAATAPPVVNLPDFTPLVERTSPAVVNIEARRGEGAGEGEADAAPAPGEEDMPEIFKRFFGPGGPGAQAPQRPRGAVSFGSGFILSADGYVLTNHHVIEGSDEILVRLADRRELAAKLVGSDPAADIALLKLAASGLPSVKLGDSRALKPGQWVMAIGSPFGFEYSVTAGIVSGVGRRSLASNQQYVPFIQTDVAINRGNSGGPLLNTRGEVVGINSQIYSNSGGFLGVSFAIPIEVAMNSVRQLKASGKVVRGQLGVQIQDVSRDLAKSYGLDRAMGAAVSRVEPGSAAAKAGIKAGDVIVGFNGKEIVLSSDLPPLVGAMPPGSRATVKLLRGGKRMDLVVSLGALDASTAQASGPAEPGAKPAGNALGLVVEALPAAAREQLGLAAGEGVRVARVEGLLARRAGISPGDVILMVGETEVASVEAFEAALRAYKPGSTVRLLVRNRQSTTFVAVTLP